MLEKQNNTHTNYLSKQSKVNLHITLMDSKFPQVVVIWEYEVMTLFFDKTTEMNITSERDFTGALSIYKWEPYLQNDKADIEPSKREVISCLYSNIE